jgi:hypothetical protein
MKNLLKNWKKDKALAHGFCLACWLVDYEYVQNFSFVFFFPNLLL